jgi:hypothetical protein
MLALAHLCRLTDISGKERDIHFFIISVEINLAKFLVFQYVPRSPFLRVSETSTLTEVSSFPQSLHFDFGAQPPPPTSYISALTYHPAWPSHLN